MAYKTNYIDVNKPSKVLSLSVSAIAGEAQWPHNDGAGDKWYASGTNPKYYQWEVTATVTAQDHGSHLTRKDFQYNGLDIQVGDWIAGATTGTCCRIVSISAKTATSVTMIVEDWLRYNTFRSSIGNGIFSTGPAVVFQLNENGHPMLDPVPVSITSGDFYLNINSRFQYLNPQMHYVLDQTAHGFDAGDVVSITSSGFAKTTTATANKVIGTVTNPGPGPNQFMIRPNTRIIDFLPAIPGSVGDFIYTDHTNAGELSTSNTSGRIQFMKITDAVTSSVTGDQVDATTATASVIEINETSVTLTESTSGAGVTIADAVGNINAGTGTHAVTASSAPSPTTCQTSTASLAYGLVGVYPGGEITINGTTVTFNTTTAGQAAYGIAVGVGADIIADINSAAPANITASANGSDVVLTESTGGAITIVNVTNDGNGSPVAGASSGTGFPLSTSASSGAFLKLTRTDGGEILLDDITGTPTVDYGVFSVHNGRMPLAVTVEQGIRTAGGTTVVNDISARNALVPQIGDTAYVIDTGETEWGYFMYNGSNWIKISDEDSAATDANSITYTFTAPVGGFGTIDTQTVGRLSPGARIVSVLVNTVTPLTGYSGNAPTVGVGTASDVDLFHDEDQNDLETAGEYVTTPGYVYPSSSTSELEVKAQLTHNGATAGEVIVTVTYV